MSEVGVMVKVTDSHPCGWGSIPGKSCCFFIVYMYAEANHCASCVLITMVTIGLTNYFYKCSKHVTMLQHLHENLFQLFALNAAMAMLSERTWI